MARGTRIGVLASAPAWLRSFLPQQYTAPSAVCAHECAAPRANFWTPESAICAGLVWGSVVPSPSCPDAFAPQQKATPAEETAQVCSAPAATVAGDCTPGPLELEGVGDCLPSPIWPE